MVFIITLVILIFFGVIIIAFLIYQSYALCKEIRLGRADSEIIYEDYLSKINISKKKQIFKKILNIFADIIIVILALFLLLGITDRFVSSDILPVKSVVVLTGSMSYKNSNNDYLFENDLNNQIGEKDLIFVERVNNIDDINLYDVICYRNQNNIQVVHRCVIKTEDYLIAKGDANNLMDDIYITNDNLVGRYTGYKIPYAGYITTFISSEYGISVISVLFLIGITYFISKQNIDKYLDYRKKFLYQNIKDLKEFSIISGGGELVVNDNDYKFIEYKEEKEILSILKISDEEEIILEPSSNINNKNNKKGESKDEKEIKR